VEALRLRKFRASVPSSSPFVFEGGRSYAATRAIGSASLSRALVGSLYIKINIPTYSRRSLRLPIKCCMVRCLSLCHCLSHYI